MPVINALRFNFSSLANSCDCLWTPTETQRDGGASFHAAPDEGAICSNQDGRGDLRDCRCKSKTQGGQREIQTPERAIVAFDFIDSHFISEAFNAGSETSKCHTRA